MTQLPSIPITSIPLIVAMWEHPDFGGVKRTLIEDVNDLSNIYFGGKTHAIGIHAGPDFNIDEARTVSFYEKPNFGGDEVCLAQGVYRNTRAFGALANGNIASIRFNPPHARAPGYYGQGESGADVQYPSNQQPAHQISPIPLVVKLYPDALTNLYPSGSQAGYPVPSQAQSNPLTLVEDALNIRAMFGSEYDGTSSGLTVQKGPNWNRLWIARLYEDVVTQEDIQNRTEPPHLDTFPDEETHPLPGGTIAQAYGVFTDLTATLFDFNDKTRAVRMVEEGVESGL